jgi:hypothetical protein
LLRRTGKRPSTWNLLERVAAELARRIARGFIKILQDIPSMRKTSITDSFAFQLALEQGSV